DRQTEETLASKPGESAELPSWLSDLEPEPSASSEDNESPETPLPIWLRDLEAPAQHKTDQPAVVLTPPEWIREESPITPEPAEVESESPLREAEQERIEPIPSEPEAAIEAAPGVPEPSLASTPGGDGDLEIAQQALRKGNVEKAVEQYSRFIQSGSLLEETIHDLRDATYRYPMDTAIWQTLGDAYLRSNRLQDALDAYTKAEELLR
ncbi:MAG TPA: hypothetical protein VHO48_09250, partial [Anaerolineaceae bacterium]|nr:hypothetical protein [Anaerolineaceae bacterium]